MVLIDGFSSVLNARITNPKCKKKNMGRNIINVFVDFVDQIGRDKSHVFRCLYV
jgi:hypothetical protein